jgi:hypothetical protein
MVRVEVPAHTQAYVGSYLIYCIPILGVAWASPSLFFAIFLIFIHSCHRHYYFTWEIIIFTLFLITFLFFAYAFTIFLLQKVSTLLGRRDIFL